MRAYNLTLLFVLLSSALLVVADSDPRLSNSNNYDTQSLPNINSVSLPNSESEQHENILEKRRGGGGRGGGSTGGSGRNGGGRPAGPPARTNRYDHWFSRPGGSRVVGYRGGARTQRTSPKSTKGQYYGSKTNSGSNSNSGGSTSAGSGSPRGFGSYYGGGAAVPYSAGKKSNSGIVPIVLAGAALGAVSGLLVAGAFAYPFNRQYNFHNDTSGRNERLPVTCICEQYKVSSRTRIPEDPAGYRSWIRDKGLIINRFADAMKPATRNSLTRCTTKHLILSHGFRKLRISTEGGLLF
jgi:hypothetical protein